MTGICGASEELCYFRTNTKRGLFLQEGKGGGGRGRTEIQVSFKSHIRILGKCSKQLTAQCVEEINYLSWKHRGASAFALHQHLSSSGKTMWRVEQRGSRWGGGRWRKWVGDWGARPAADTLRLKS